MNEIGYKPYTVADLISDLAGLPPMMEIFIMGTAMQMYIDKLEIFGKSVFIFGTSHPKPKEIDPETYEEQLAKMRQKAMHMAAVSERETQMHRVVD